MLKQFKPNKILIFSKEQLPNTLGIVLIVSAIVTYYVVVFRFAVNVPFWDDYCFGLYWLDKYVKSDFPDSILLLFNQANEHRLFSYSATVFLEYSIFGEFNCRDIIIFGNAWMIGLAYLFYRLKDYRQNDLLSFSPVILLLFIPQHGITDWGIMTMNSIFEFFLVFSSLFFLNKNGNLNFIVSIVLAIIATFSFGNGMFVFLAGFVILFLHGTKSVKRIALWVTCMLLCISLYFVKYIFLASSNSIMDIIHHPFNGFLFFLSILGNLFSSLIKNKIIPYYIAGSIIILSFIYLVLKKWKYHKSNPLALSFLVFLLLSAAAVTISRFGIEVEIIATYRYMLIPELFVCTLYIVYLNTYQKRQTLLMYLLTIACLILYANRLWTNFQGLSTHKTVLTDSILSYYADADNTTLQYPIPQQASMMISKGIENGFYLPPTISQLYPDIRLLHEYKSITYSKDIIMNIDKTFDNRLFLDIEGWAFLKEDGTDDQQINITLITQDNAFIFSTRKILRNDVVSCFKDSYPNLPGNCGFKFVLDKRKFNVPPQNYQVGVAINKNGIIEASQLSDRSVNFGSPQYDSIIPGEN